MAKVCIGPNGELVTYGLDGEMARNYIKHGKYVKDSELLRKRIWRRKKK